MFALCSSSRISLALCRRVSSLSSKALALRGFTHGGCVNRSGATLPSFPRQHSQRPPVSRPRSRHSQSTFQPHINAAQFRAINSIALEEETLSDYNAEDFYPVHPRTTINSRYQVIGKLAYGANSTVWLCRDSKDQEYVVAKVYVRTPSGRLNREEAAYEQFETISTTHPGALNIRPALDMFNLVQPIGDRHECLIHPPLQCTPFDFQGLSGTRRALPKDLVKIIMIELLQALDFLHTEANTTHCGKSHFCYTSYLKLSNVMLRLDDSAVLSDFEKESGLLLSEQKVINKGRAIYSSRPLRPPHANAYGSPVLCDFGEARIGASHAYAEIQPEIYKTPEILMQFDWGHSVDLWNAACLMSEMLEAEHLVNGRDSEGFHNNRCHMHEIVTLLANPPDTFLRRSPHASRLFDDKGLWKADPPVHRRALEDRMKHLAGGGKAKATDFLLCMLRWLPEARLTARELLRHEWLSDTTRDIL